MLDIDFGSTADDNSEPWNKCSRVCQNLQNAWTTPGVTALVQCVNDKDEGMLWVATEGVDETKRVLHRLWGQIYVIAKTVRHNVSKRGEAPREFVDESRKDIARLAQKRVVLLAEKRSSEALSI